MDILIITVGTRQIGWQCKDGIIRCFGVDGNQNYPPHIDELYAELNIERGSHEAGVNWGVRHLGEAYYQHCQQNLGRDFSAVQLLMDGKIIRDLAEQGLQTIILWATNQPESIPWRYRSSDTLWLARLMQQKIKADFPNLQVDVIDTELNISDTQKVYEELQEIVLPLALEQINDSRHNPNLKVAIQTKGCAPAIANAVDIFSGTLVRQFQLFKVTPEEPANNYRNGSAKFAQKVEIITVSEYFWLLEKKRIEGAWDRGDFAEAQTWLTAHQSKLLSLHELAELLNLARNREVAQIFNNRHLGRWLADESTVAIAGSVKCDIWKKKRQEINQDLFKKLWENTFLIKIDLRLNYLTSAFFSFAQLIEQLLFLRAQQDNWIERYIEVPNDWNSQQRMYDPNLKQLIDALEKTLPNNNESRYKINILHEIRKSRNDLVHQNMPIVINSYAQIIDLDRNKANQASVYNQCIEVLSWILKDREQKKESTLLESLHLWGLEMIKKVK
ncbi:hypothetical protein AWQ21_15190 (plasmid) [Picosynechococcus sp. PCC 7003]|uniref:hypothetical protein n=1 Tax=Picosynechococcus sp. PCC 7003 TaxID=374981 RepID=UPI0008108FA1|nr:hypothetical protein [Picosynechococcus sp. PCC 7003]ANV85873.1 hypothetical protein AWQ21_15190 [Picosynechococcus sp. PCC 7003]